MSCLEDSPRDLVLALGAGLHAGELVGDRIFDRLIVADLEMQKRMLLDGAPEWRPNSVSDPMKLIAPAIYLPLRRAITSSTLSAMVWRDQRIELAGEIRPAPFARPGIHVEAEERVPHRFASDRSR